MVTGGPKEAGAVAAALDSTTHKAGWEKGRTQCSVLSLLTLFIQHRLVKMGVKMEVSFYLRLRDQEWTQEIDLAGDTIIKGMKYRCGGFTDHRLVTHTQNGCDLPLALCSCLGKLFEQFHCGWRLTALEDQVLS